MSTRRAELVGQIGDVLWAQGLRTLGIPWGLIGLMLVASVLVGVLAAVAPSIRATRLNILGAINRA